MSKNIRVIVFLLIMMVSVTACSKSKEPNVPVRKLIDAIGEKIAKDNNSEDVGTLDWNLVDLTKEEGTSLVDMMELKSQWIEEGIYYESASNESADRIILIKVEDDKDVRKVKKAFEDTMKSQESDWKDIKKEEYDKVKKGTIAVQGRYLMYIVYDDVSGIKKIIEDKLLEK